MLNGATASILTFSNLTAANDASFTVVVSNSAGVVYTTNSPAVLTVVTPPSFYAAMVAQLDPIAYWPLNESSGTNALNYGALAQDGVINGSMGLGATGATGTGFGSTHNAYQFDGATTYVNCGGNFPVNPTTHTLVVWVQASPFGGNAGEWCPVATEGNSSWRVQRWHNTESIEDSDSGTVPGSDGSEYLRSAQVIDDGNWHMLVAVKDVNSRSFYMDGVLDVTGTTVGDTATNGEDVVIGSNIENTGNCWPGMISDVAMFNYAFSASDVATLYAVAQQGTPSLAIITPPQSQQVEVAASVDLVGGGHRAVAGELSVVEEQRSHFGRHPGHVEYSQHGLRRQRHLHGDRDRRRFPSHQPAGHGRGSAAGGL